MASDTQVPLFWQGAAKQGAHFDMRLISTGPVTDVRKREGEGEREAGESRYSKRR